MVFQVIEETSLISNYEDEKEAFMMELKKELAAVDFEDILTLIFAIINIIIAVTVFSIVFLRMLSHKLDYINEIEKGIKILEGGDLENVISQVGEDELTNLAVSINNMSSAMRDRIEGERQAREANKLLITNLSHDIRTPLTPIIGYLTILKDDINLTYEQRQKYLSTALAKAEQLKERTNMLFEYALLCSNKKKLNKVKVNAKEILEQFIFENTLVLNNNGFSVETIIDVDDAVEIEVDINEFSRVFDNIISNIIKYGSDTVVFNVVTEYKLKITVTNAISIEGKALSTGLGNNICKNIIELHGGSFNCYEADSLYSVEISL